MTLHGFFLAVSNEPQFLNFMQIQSAGDLKTKEEMANCSAASPYLPVALCELERGPDASARAARVASTEVVECEKCTAEEAWGSPISVKKASEVQRRE